MRYNIKFLGQFSHSENLYSIIRSADDSGGQQNGFIYCTTILKPLQRTDIDNSKSSLEIRVVKTALRNSAN